MPQHTHYPVANSVGPQQVRETADSWVIEDVPIVKSMRLAGGYVPEESVRETADAWAGVPVTLNHPRDDSGMPVAANQQPETHIGTTEAPYYDGTHVRGNIRLEKARLDGRGAEATRIETALDNGETIDVSSQYAAEPLPAGEYDGQVRENVERITRPDSVAILPTKTGVCTIEDGCGINPQLAANAAVSVPMTANGDYGDKDMASSAEAEFEAGDLVRWSTSAAPGTGRVADVAVEPGATVSAEGADVTREATAEEPAYKLDNWTGDGYDEGAVVKSASEILGAWDDAPDEALSANMDVPEKYVLDNPGEAVEMASEMGFGEDADLAGDELIHTHEAGGETVFMPGPSHEALLDRLEELGEMDADGDTDTDTDGDDMSDNSVRAALRTLRAALSGADDEADASEDPDRGPASTRDRAALIDDITSNSPLTRHALEARCDEGLAAIHDDVMAAADTGVSGNTDDSDAAADTTTTTMSDSDPIELDDLSENAREALVDEAVERIEANRETEQKEQLVSEIIANAADYDSDDRETLLETPLDVLRSLNTSTQAAGLPGTGATANAAPSTGSDDSVEEYPDGMIGGDL